ncbi:MAG: hypothetical protein ACYTEZ_04720 [Planctomycetota bacterium]|jgi:hypothetical protein
MRAAGALLFLAAAGLATDLRPRAGGGWSGFRPGSWVRMRRTAILKGRAPSVTVWTQTLVKASDKLLTLETVSRNALGMERNDTLQVPVAGEAGAGERQKVQRLKNEVVLAAGKRYDCARTRTTITGPRGKRVVTLWTAPRPQVWAKRSEEYYDPAGKLAYRTTWLLSSLDERRRVGSRTVRCVKYKTRLDYADGREERGEAFASRDVPGSTVWMETQTYRGTETVLTMRVELLAFQVK